VNSLPSKEKGREPLVRATPLIWETCPPFIHSQWGDGPSGRTGVPRTERVATRCSLARSVKAGALFPRAHVFSVRFLR
jgi:hypothetical protein